MSATEINIIISALTLAGSWGGAGLIVAFRGGAAVARLNILEQQMQRMATKDQLAGVKEDIAEIKGMFRMTLKDGNS